MVCGLDTYFKALTMSSVMNGANVGGGNAMYVDRIQGVQLGCA